MSCLLNLLEQLSPRVEAELRPHLRSLVRGTIVRHHLPQVWVFDTDAERVSFIVDHQGAVSALGSSDPPLDVLISVSHDVLSTALEAALGLRDSHAVIRGPITPTFYTRKGERAFNYLRQRIGL